MNRNRDTHTCKAINCNEQIPLARLMCAKHWAMVPSPQQVEVLRTWKAFTKSATREQLKQNRSAYWQAKRQAINAVALIEASQLKTP